MIKRSVFFGSPYHLHVEQAQLLAEGKAECEGKRQRIPIEDLGFLVLEHPQITFTQRLMQLLMDHNVGVICCDEKHMPVGMWLPLNGHHLQSERFRAQVSASEPLKKQLWQQTIEAKIKSQGLLIDYIGGEAKAFETMARRVKSGDIGGEEALAARRYWPLLFSSDFRRGRGGDPPNGLLNYGYAILRGAVARALTASGLLPTLGIHHSNRYNAYCLADDIMEPFRPLVDMLTWKRWVKDQNKSETLSQEDKRMFLQMLAADLRYKEQTRPLMVALSHLSASLSACFEGKVRKLVYPQLLFAE